MDRQLLKLLTEKGALKLAKGREGFFLTKSGRLSPYFVNVGALTDGESLNELKRAFARKIKQLLDEKKLEDFDFIFGPAYKGIPLAALVCEDLYEQYGMSKRFIYDRKEEKAYGDKGADRLIVGADSLKPGAKVLLIDDVITTGLAKFDAIEKLKAVCNCKLVGAVIAFDRQERGGNSLRPLNEAEHAEHAPGRKLLGDKENVEQEGAAELLKRRAGVQLFSILTLSELFSEVKGGLAPDVRAAWLEYIKKYGTSEAKGAVK